jgi:hypothetical protein
MACYCGLPSILLSGNPSSARKKPKEGRTSGEKSKRVGKEMSVDVEEQQNDGDDDDERRAGQAAGRVASRRAWEKSSRTIDMNVGKVLSAE